jgi:hypothetical protein
VVFMNLPEFIAWVRTQHPLISKQALLAWLAESLEEHRTIRKNIASDN